MKIRVDALVETEMDIEVLPVMLEVDEIAWASPLPNAEVEAMMDFTRVHMRDGREFDLDMGIDKFWEVCFGNKSEEFDLEEVVGSVETLVSWVHKQGHRPDYLIHDINRLSKWCCAWHDAKEVT